MHPITRIIMFFCLSGLLVACNSDTTSSITETNGPIIGDKVTAGNLTYEVNSANKATDINTPFNTRIKPENGTYILINLSIHNGSSTEIKIDKSMFYLQDKSGNIYHPHAGFDDRFNESIHGLFNHPIQPMTKIQAILLFDVPDRSTASYYLIAKGDTKLQKQVYFQLIQ